MPLGVRAELEVLLDAAEGEVVEAAAAEEEVAVVVAAAAAVVETPAEAEETATLIPPMTEVDAVLSLPVPVDAPVVAAVALAAAADAFLTRQVFPLLRFL